MESNPENKQSIPCGFNKFLKHTKNPKGTLIKYSNIKYKLAVDVLL